MVVDGHLLGLEGDGVGFACFSGGLGDTSAMAPTHSQSAEVDPPTFTKLCANTPRRKPHCKAHIIQHACVPMKARRLGVNGQSWHSDADTSQARTITSWMQYTSHRMLLKLDITVAKS